MTGGLVSTRGRAFAARSPAGALSAPARGDACTEAVATHQEQMQTRTRISGTLQHLSHQARYRAADQHMPAPMANINTRSPVFIRPSRLASSKVTKAEADDVLP